MLALVLVATMLVVVSVKCVHPFLAVNDPVPGGALVVEGWMPDYGFKQAVADGETEEAESRSKQDLGAASDHAVDVRGSDVRCTRG